MLGLLVVAVALGLSNFGAAIGIGIGGVRGATRIRVAVVFGLFEAGMPLLGLAIGRAADAGLGGGARWGGGALLIAVGVYGVVLALRESGRGDPARPAAGAASVPGAAGGAGAACLPGAAGGAGAACLPGAVGGAGARRWGTGRVLVSGLALSVDNLAVGFVLGTYRVNLAVAALVVGGVSVAMSLIGLELGAKAGVAAGRRGELVGAAVLIAVGAVMAAGAR